MRLEDLIENTPSLPATPEVLPKLVRIMKDGDTDSEDLISLISTDPPIVAGVLKLANSSLYSPSSPITDLQEATALLGMNEIYRIVSNLTGNSFLDGELTSMEIGKGGLWTHSLAVATVMEIIANSCSDMDGLPYTLGLLHDIGKLVLHHACGERYESVFSEIEREKIPINVAEAAVLGFDHAQAGALVLEQWDFPEDIYLPIRHQYEPSQAGEFESLASALRISNWAAGVMGCSDGRDSWALDMTGHTFDIEQSELERAIIEAKTRMDKARRALTTERDGSSSAAI